MNLWSLDLNVYDNVDLQRDEEIRDTVLVPDVLIYEMVKESLKSSYSFGANTFSSGFDSLRWLWSAFHVAMSRFVQSRHHGP